MSSKLFSTQRLAVPVNSIGDFTRETHDFGIYLNFMQRIRFRPEAIRSIAPLIAILVIALIVLLIVPIKLFVQTPTAKQDGDNYTALIAKGNRLLQQQKYSEAYSNAMVAAKLDSKRFEAFALAGFILEQQGSLAKALNILEEAISRAPKEKREKLLQFAFNIQKELDSMERMPVSTNAGGQLSPSLSAKSPTGFNHWNLTNTLSNSSKSVKKKALPITRQEFDNRVQSAKEFAQQEDYLKASSVLSNIDISDDCTNELASLMSKIFEEGERSLSMKTAAAVIRKDYQDANNNLRKLAALQNREPGNDEIQGLIRTQTTAQFLSALSALGLRSDDHQNRKRFADVMLVNATLPLLSDPDHAKKFLGTSYLEWASEELEMKHFGTACYLALLAQQHGQTSAGNVFKNAYKSLLGKYSIIIDSVAPFGPMPTQVDMDFVEAARGLASAAIRVGTPNFITFADPGRKSGNASNTAFRVELRLNLLTFNSKSESNERDDSRSHTVQSLADNPEYDRAVEDVEQAQNRVERAQNSLEAAERQAESCQRQLAFQPSPYAALAASLDTVANQAILTMPRKDLNEAKSDLHQAKAKLEKTPRQIKESHDELVTWSEVDNVTTFNSKFLVAASLAGNDFYERSFESLAVHKSVQRDGKPEIGLAPVRRRAPNLEKIQKILLAGFKSRFSALSSLEFNRQLKRAITNSLDASKSAVSDGPQDAMLEGELLWWDTPLRDYTALASPFYRVRFGGVISESAVPIIEETMLSGIEHVSTAADLDLTTLGDSLFGSPQSVGSVYSQVKTKTNTDVKAENDALSKLGDALFDQSPK